VALGLLAAFSPFAVDVYLPAFPSIVREFGSTATGVQLSLTFFIVAMAIGMPVFGTLSDRFGRRPCILVAVAVCIVASAAAALAPTLEFLLAARALQGFTSAAGVVVGRAVVADLATGDVAARAYGMVAIVGNVAPIVAPVVGAFAAIVSWRFTLWVLVALAVAVLVICAIVLPESNPPERRVVRAERRAGPTALQPLLGRRFIGNALVAASVTMLMFGYVAAAPFIYQEVMGFDHLAFAAIFALSAIGMLATNWYTNRLIGRFTVRGIMLVGLAATVGAAASLLVLVLAGVRDAWLVIPMVLFVSCTGATLPKAVALAMAEVRSIAGTGSAVLSVAQFGVGSISTPLVGLSGSDSPLAFALVIAATSVLAGLAAWLARGGRFGLAVAEPAPEG